MYFRRAADPRDSGIVIGCGWAADFFRIHDHRAKFEDVKMPTMQTDTQAAVKCRSPVFNFDSQCNEDEYRTQQEKTEKGGRVTSSRRFIKAPLRVIGYIRIKFQKSGIWKCKSP